MTKVSVLARLRPFRVPLAVFSLVAAVVGIGGGLLFGLNPGFAVALLAVIIGVTAFWLDRRTSRSGDVSPEATIGFPTVAAHMAVVSIATLALSQLVPYGRTHANPPVTGEPEWSSPRTRELTVNACFGCHSNETEWPWYANVAPISWAVANHVDEGRSVLNFSEFDKPQRGADDIIEVIREGSMPPGCYTNLGRHPEAKLTDAEIAELIAGLQQTPGIGDRSGHD